MDENLLELLSSLSKDKNKVAAVAEQLSALLTQPKSKGKANPDITKDGVTYRFCCWSKRYFPLSEFVGDATKKTYTRAAYKIWSGFPYRAEKMKMEATNKYIEQTIDKPEFERLIREADEYAARRNNFEEFAEVTKLGFTAEQLS